MSLNRQAKIKLLKSLLRGESCPIPLPIQPNQPFEFRITPGGRGQDAQFHINGHEVSEAVFRQGERWYEEVTGERFSGFHIIVPTRPEGKYSIHTSEENDNLTPHHL